MRYSLSSRFKSPRPRWPTAASARPSRGASAATMLHHLLVGRQNGPEIVRTRLHVAFLSHSERREAAAAARDGATRATTNTFARRRQARICGKVWNSGPFGLAASRESRRDSPVNDPKSVFRMRFWRRSTRPVCAERC